MVLNRFAKGFLIHWLNYTDQFHLWWAPLVITVFGIDMLRFFIIHGFFIDYDYFS